MGICWVNNLPDMISMQNWLFWKHAQGVWSDNQGLFAGSEEREYMGWNEVPVTRVAIDDPSNWDAFLIKLPANICDKVRWRSGLNLVPGCRSPDTTGLQNRWIRQE